MSLLLRRLHGYVGMLVAPTVLFFALTGLLQIYQLHEAHGDYIPPTAIAMLGQFHKDQAVPSRPVGRRPEHKGGGEHAAPPPLRLTTKLLKAFFAVAAVSLALSTLVGVWIGLQDKRRRTISFVLLLAGVALPLLLAMT